MKIMITTRQRALLDRVKVTLNASGKPGSPADLADGRGVPVQAVTAILNLGKNAGELIVGENEFWFTNEQAAAWKHAAIEQTDEFVTRKAFRETTGLGRTHSEAVFGVIFGGQGDSYDEPKPRHRSEGYSESGESRFQARAQREEGYVNQTEGEANPESPEMNSEGATSEARPPRDNSNGDNPPQRSNGDRPARTGGYGDRGQRKYGDRPSRPGGYGDRPQRPGGYGDRPQREGGYSSDRPQREGGYSNARPQRSFGHRAPREGGYQPRPYGDRAPREGGYQPRPYGDRPPRDGGYNNDRPQRSFGDRPPREGG